MANDTLPAVVRQFLARHIQSVEQLEVLLLLRSEPQRAWTVGEVYDVIRSSTASIASRLKTFTNDGFAIEEATSAPAYRFAPKDDNLRMAIDQTATAYQVSRVRVIEAIFTPASDPVQTFADAFRLRRD